MLITILGAVVAAQVADTDVCLLSLGQKVVKRQAGQEAKRDFSKLFREVDARRAHLSGWSRSTQELRQKALEDPSLKELLGEGGMDEFIKAQGESSDVCHSKMLEAKRSLDGLIHQVQRLATEIEAENSVIEGNTNTIKDALEKKKDAEDTKASDDALCDEKAEAAKTETLGAIKTEIAEMKNIADPKVRSTVATDVDYSEVIQEHLEDVRTAAATVLTDEEREEVVEEAKAAFIQTEEHITTAIEELANSLVAVDARGCKAVMAVLTKVQRAHNLLPANTTAETPACDQARNNLQKEFTTAFTEMTELYDRKAQEIGDTNDDCKLKAHEAFEEKNEAIKEMVKDATDSIANAKSTLEGLEPVLSDTKTSVEKLRAHIADQEKTCEMDDDVSEHLSNIRDLIVDLEECPGKNDFVLEIPEWKPPS